MNIQQLSLFVENEPGQILRPCRLLADAGINIRTLSVADTKQFGILRLIVSEPKRALQLFQDAGYVVNVTDVVAVEVPDRPGGLSDVIAVFENSNINIEYMYAFPFGRADTAVLIFRFDRPEAAAELLKCAGISVVSGAEGYDRVNR